MNRKAALIAGFLLYIFAGAGIYWNFLGWFRNAALAGVSGGVIPLILFWLLWSDWQARTH
jgi:hypothetical protein